MKTTLALRDASTGQTIDLTERIVQNVPTLNNDSIIDVLASPTGVGFVPGWVTKKSKRTQTKLVESTGIGSAPAFKDATSQSIYRVRLDKVIREDNILTNEVDLVKLAEGSGPSLMATEVGDFILTGKELDAEELLADAFKIAVTDDMKLFTTVSKANAGDLYGTVPAGTQPTQADTKFATAIVALQGGKRSVVADDMFSITTKDGAMRLLRAALGYLNKIGSKRSPEALYPHSINGIPLTRLRVVSTYEDVVNIKDSLTTTVVNLNNPGTARNLNGLVAFVDTVPVYLSNQINEKDAFVVASDRVFARDMDPNMQYVGVVKKNIGSIVVNGVSQNVGPNQMVTQMQVARVMGVKYQEEIFFIRKAA